MKKLKYLSLFAILLLFCFWGIPSHAKDSSLTFSEDLQKLYVDGASFSRYDTSMVEVESYIALQENIVLSETQKEIIKNVSLQSDEYKNIIYANISFQDGAVLSVEFLRDEYISVMGDMMSGKTPDYYVDFEWPEDNIVKVERNALLGESATLDSDALMRSEYFKLVAQSEDSHLQAITGALLTVSDKYYYVDFISSGIASYDSFDPYELERLNVYEISDVGLLADFKEAKDSYYDDNLGFFLDDNFTHKISTVFLMIMFAIIPLIVCLVFLFFAFRSKGFYRKLFSIITVCSACELIIFVIIVVLGAVLR